VGQKKFKPKEKPIFKFDKKKKTFVVVVVVTTFQVFKLNSYTFGD